MSQNYKLASVITVNYNSKKIAEVVLKSIETMINLDWRPLELILVDNGSTDGSFEGIEDYVRKKANTRDVEIKFVRLVKNVGFAAGNNEGLRRANPKTDFLAIINNDLSPEKASLRGLISFLEDHRNVAGVQPKVLSWDGKKIDSAGGMLTSSGATGIGQYLDSSALSTSPYHVSHIYGGYSLYRADAIRDAGGLFLPDFFMYGDDYELGIRLWRRGYELAYVPVIGGRHFGSATGKGKPFVSYWASKSEISVMIMYGGLFSSDVVLRIIGVSLYTLTFRQKVPMRGLVDGISFGIKMRGNSPREMRRARIYAPHLGYSVVDWFFMHTRFQYLARRRIAREMLRKFKIDKK